MALTWKQLSFRVAGHYDDREATDETISLQISSYEVVKTSLLQAINEEDRDTFRESLEKQFIYRIEDTTYQKTYKGNFHKKHSYEKYCLARPNIEALFFDRWDVLKDILQALEGKSDLTQDFINVCRRGTCIPEQVFRPLEESQVSKLFANIESLAQFPSLHDLANNLKACLDTRPKDKERGVTHFGFKLKFLEMLHNQDKTMELDKNYRCIVINAAMILLGFIPNFILWLATDNFLFFKHTPQQTCIARINAPLGFFKPQAIDFSSQKCPEIEDLYEEGLYEAPFFIEAPW